MQKAVRDLPVTAVKQAGQPAVRYCYPKYCVLVIKWHYACSLEDRLYGGSYIKLTCFYWQQVPRSSVPRLTSRGGSAAPATACFHVAAT
jgi:hypothetical protein